jgi:hypothetical protein
MKYSKPLIFGLGPLKYFTVVQLAIEILNISCTKSVAGPREFLLGY